MILILAILTLAVMASGCTDNQSANKKYSSNEISFTYPGNWSETSISDIQNTVGNTTNVTVVVGEGNDREFALGKVNIQSCQKTVSPEKWRSRYKSVIESDGLQVLEVNQ
ncbi:MAG: hypothetical protein ABFD07_10145 [Methanobacterium sp.]